MDAADITAGAAVVLGLFVMVLVLRRVGQHLWRAFGHQPAPPRYVYSDTCRVCGSTKDQMCGPDCKGRALKVR